MASHAPNYGRASALSLSAVLGAIPSYPRPVIERLVSRLIEYLDDQDGDPDADENDAEDAFAFSQTATFYLTDYRGPGCPISDPGGEEATI